VAALKKQLGKNSTNSHRPPSMDSPDDRKKRNAKKRSGRKRGGQPGRQGVRRALVPTEQVDRVTDYYPETCQYCGEELDPKQSVGEPLRRQVTELPEPKPEVEEHRAHSCRCTRCQRVTRAEWPKSVMPSSFGPRLLATIALLTGGLRLSRRRAVDLLKWLYGIDVSVGAVSQSEGRVAEALSSPMAEAEAHVKTEQVKHCDATGWRLGTASRALWTIATSLVTLFRITSDGTREQIRGLLGTTLGILVSDRAKVFLFWSMAQRQICWAHLIRQFVGFTNEAEEGKRIGDGLLEQTWLMFHFWHRVRDGTLSRIEFQDLVLPIEHRIVALLEQGSAVADIGGSCKDMLAHRDALFTFIDHEGVEPTNNHAERELRALVLWRKTSFGSQSERGLRFVERMMTVVKTLQKQRRDLLSYLTEVMRHTATGAPVPSLLPVKG